jgi:23S rRNA (cytidine1920-2'-O)/16S rRNA (cytidine1409-2'-O)-methyltransferase
VKGSRLKSRLDKTIVDRGLVPSRERAQALIIAGRVLVNDQKVTKPGTTVAAAATIRILGDDLRYVSRGGLKLEHALCLWHLDIIGKTCMDVGASTGGFTDCMLQHGAAKVIAIDTGYGQIDSRFRSHPQVRLLENTNARYLQPSDVPEPVDFIAMDVSFISATLVLPAVIHAGFKAGGGDFVVLVKPQFEVGREAVGKGGIVRDETEQRSAIEKVAGAVTASDGRVMATAESPIRGAKGNREFLLHAVFDPKS